jgi:hypothetical protein
MDHRQRTRRYDQTAIWSPHKGRDRPLNLSRVAPPKFLSAQLLDFIGVLNQRYRHDENLAIPIAAVQARVVTL